MIFLDLYIRFFQVQVSATIAHVFYCNNQGLLNRMVSSQDCAWDNPTNHCLLSSEYDTESGIINILLMWCVSLSSSYSTTSKIIMTMNGTSAVSL
jgi:hypothetical protein